MKNWDYMHDIIDNTVDLNSLEATDIIKCPYCGKGKTYVYTATGMSSNPCGVCHRIALWDFDHHIAYKANIRKFAS